MNHILVFLTDCRQGRTKPPPYQERTPLPSYAIKPRPIDPPPRNQNQSLTSWSLPSQRPTERPPTSRYIRGRHPVRSLPQGQIRPLRSSCLPSQRSINPPPFPNTQPTALNSLSLPSKISRPGTQPIQGKVRNVPLCVHFFT